MRRRSNGRRRQSEGRRPDGLSEVGGRVDLRGIGLTATPASVGDKDDPSAGVSWEALDLTEAQLDELRVFGGRITDCVFAASVWASSCGAAT